MENLEKEMIAWRHYLHQHPGTAFEETAASELIAQKLTEWGYEVETGIGKTGVVGKLTRGDGRKTVAFRADMDANAILEQGESDHKSLYNGKMHACGHDGHTAQLLGAACLLSQNEDFSGTVLFVFQPAEEPGKGAQAMIDDGFFDRYPIDEFYGCHNMPNLPAGAVHTRGGGIMGSEDDFVIRIHGRGGHASSPHLGVDPLVIASQIILSLQTITSRNANPLHSVVCSCTELLTDGAVNAIPSNVTIKGDTRSTDPDDQAMIEERMRAIVKGVCEAGGADWEFEYSHEFAPTVNTQACSDAVADAASALFGETRVDANCEPWMASEDFGTFLRHTDGCFFLIGSGREGCEPTPLHNACFDYNDSILLAAARLFEKIAASRLK